MRLTRWTWLLTCSTLLILSASGCSLKATFKESTDTTSNVTGTTSGRTWFTEDGLLHPEHKLTAFTTLNRANLEQDLARGEGEYVASLATLLGVPVAQQSIFHAKAQESFETLTDSDHEIQLDQLRMLVR
ncbi:MAG: DUF3015 family protein [Nitrospirae bacterium]|nr:DUF3015 family protein [Nitrospirota bacterium]